ncbi:MAG: polysaccharide biosynthesis tyrosine autokinase [Candidatus Binatia bacterium]
MSDIFDALVKAQREAEGRRHGATNTQADAVSASGNGASVGRATAAAPRRAATAGSRDRRRGWRARLWSAIHRNGHERRVPLLLASPDSVVGEQFRVLRTRIETVGPGSLMITSALDREGKTACAANLAIALSMSVGPEVILVDADLRNSSVGAYFGVTAGPGLAECLMGEADWRNCLVPTQYSGLHVLPAGHHTVMANELLGSERMRSLTTELKREFPRHHIIFDTPPILLTADPEVVARYMDRVVLVVRAGVAPRAAVLKAIEALHADRFLGIVFNEATESVSSYYYYGRGYGYRKRGEDIS